MQEGVNRFYLVPQAQAEQATVYAEKRVDDTLLGKLQTLKLFADIPALSP